MNYIQNAHKYPYITDLVNNGGGVSMEYIRSAGFVAVAFDEVGVIWAGKDRYDSIEALLDDAERGIKKWAEQNW